MIIGAIVANWHIFYAKPYLVESTRNWVTYYFAPDSFTESTISSFQFNTIKFNDVRDYY